MANVRGRHRLPVFFYRTEAGNEPVRVWLKGLDREDRKAIGIDLLRVQEEWPEADLELARKRMKEMQP
jgi:phage-related protein